MSVYDHLEELRRRLLVALAAVLAGTAASFAFATRILVFLERPMHGYPLHFTAPLEPLFALLKISVGVGLIVAGPVVVYQAIAFVLPALTRRERRLLFAYLPLATALFFMGLAFGFFVFIPLVLSAMFRLSGAQLQPILTVGAYTSFLISFMLPFGVVFELPVVVTLLVKLDVLTAETLARGRRWALLVSAFVAAVFAPPDPVTPLVMAAPIYLLYEVSVWVARIVGRRRPAAPDPEAGPGPRSEG
jgi:sec-independent protein translocase protein TatC